MPVIKTQYGNWVKREISCPITSLARSLSLTNTAFEHIRTSTARQRLLYGKHSYLRASKARTKIFAGQ
jgi:hypothetical protein